MPSATSLARTAAAQAPGVAEWKTGIFQCAMDPLLFGDVCLCMPCDLARIHNVVFYDRANEMPIGPLIRACFAPACTSVWARKRAVIRYGIAEEMPMTCVYGWCCLGCSVCQLHRECTLHGKWPGGTVLLKPPTDIPGMS